MAKFVLLLILGVLIWSFWRQRHDRPESTSDSRPEQKMVICAHCGVHFPETDGVGDGDRRFCSELHRLADTRPSS